MADFLLGGRIDPATSERAPETTVLGSSDLTTHGVIVGMTGSGKTGLGIVLVEEALRAGVPALLIDPKGDLTNLCLTFPNLAAEDFAPWVNEGDASKAGQSVADFAAAQANLWKDGLAGWQLGGQQIGELRERVEFTIYTPGSSSGLGLNIIGSLAAPTGDAASDTEIVGDEIEGFVSGLLGLVDVDADPLTSREHILLSNLIHNEWSAGRSLDLAGLVALVITPPLRKLGVFELDAFFPPDDRRKFAMRLNGLLASPSFASWLEGDPLEIETMLRTPDGRPRCAIVTTAHLSDEERQFVTTLVLGKLVTWMRRQSGTTDLRALLYMDEVAGYLPPTAVPPTKKPIMTLMKQARAFGVGVVLSTQNPVDIDYKALSNAGTWMIGRLQTERDKQRLLDGMSAATGGVDLGTLADTIGGLPKRAFVLRRAGKDVPEVFTTRWAMSYLRGPLARDQISTLMAPQRLVHETPETPAPTTAATPPPNAASASPSASPFPPPSSPAAPAPSTPTPAAPPQAAAPLDGDETSLVPEVAASTPVRWADPAAPWLATVGADPTGTHYAAAIVARVALRYDEARADLVHDEEYEAVLYPLADPPDASTAISVDHDDRDFRAEPPSTMAYRLPKAPIDTAGYLKRVERNLIDHLVRSKTVELQTNRRLKLWSRPGEAPDDFEMRCRQAADTLADADMAKLREKYATRTTSLRTQIQTARDHLALDETQEQGRRSEEVLSTAGSILGALLGGRKSKGAIMDSAASHRTRSAAAGKRSDAAEHKLDGLLDEMDQLEVDLARELTEIDARWMEAASQVAPVTVPLERTDVRVTELVITWLPIR